MFLIVTKSLMTDYQTKMLINQNLSTYYLKYQNIDSSYIEIKHTQSENKVFISIYRLTTFTGTFIKNTLKPWIPITITFTLNLT